MKLLLLPLLLAGAGAGWYGVSANDETPQTCDENCRVTVECTDRDTCIVTCYDADGEVRCRQEVPCDGPCEKACDEPCDEAAGAKTSQACVPGPACRR